MLAAALNRTLLIMSTDLRDDVPADELLQALTSTTVVLSAGEGVLATHSGQCAFVTAATLMARCGHTIWLDAPNVELVGNNPPVRERRLIDGLVELGFDLLPGRSFNVGNPTAKPDLAIIFGADSSAPDAVSQIHLTADDWSASIVEAEDATWAGGEWPIGGLAAAALASGEAFKVAMRRLRSWAASPLMFDAFYAPARAAHIRLAPQETPKQAKLGRVDLISGGAIGNAFLYALLRVRGCTGAIRVMDDDASALSNLNRNALLRRSRLDLAKVEDLASFGTEELEIQPLVHRFEGDEARLTLADTVIVGVDHIPSRWAAQRSDPHWLGIGATERFLVQVSHHEPGTACAQCLHPEDAPLDGPIPTVAFVSFWAGLLLATALLRKAAGMPSVENEQQTFFACLRPESWDYAQSLVPVQEGCPTCGAAALVS